MSISPWAHKPQAEAPEILIFFHLPKTGGTSMDAILTRCFPGGQHFDGAMADMRSALLVRPRDKIEARYDGLNATEKRAVRCVMGTHYPFGIHTMLDRPAKYFTILRPPVQRTISHFLNNLKMTHQPFYNRIKDMTMDEYLDSGVGIDCLDCQVRLLSGCPELDAVRDPGGGRISAPSVERRHLELAKRNIERHFITAAPMESFDRLLLFLRSLYGWKLRQLLYIRHNVGRHVPAAHQELISPGSRKRLEELNRYDSELYEWAKARFEDQTRAIEPYLSRDLRQFQILNAAAQRVRQILPYLMSKPVGRALASKPELAKQTAPKLM